MVKNAVAKGLVNESRYLNYLNMLESEKSIFELKIIKIESNKEYLKLVLQ